MKSTQKIAKSKTSKEPIFLCVVIYPFGAINEACHSKSNGAYRIYSLIENPTFTKNLMNLMTGLKLYKSLKDYFYTKGAEFLPNQDVEYQ